MSIRLAYIFRWLLVAAWALAACSQPANAPTPTGAFTDTTAHCPWNLADTRASLPGFTLRCGVVSVPEFHAQPSGPHLRLAVLLAQRDSAHPTADAVLYLAGGPGNRVQPGLLASFAEAGRDVILFDQRGVGNSQPALNCPAVGNRDPLSAALESTAALTACRDDLVRQGANLAAYTIPEDAADVDSLRQALGYEQLDLYGVSYGTQVGLAVIRDYPASLRSVVLDSVLPMPANLAADLPANIERALNLALAACAADPLCGPAHPNLKQDFYQLLAQLDAHPAALTVNGAAASMSGVRLTQLLLAVLIQGPQSLPQLVAQARAGDLSGLAQLLSSAQAPSTDTAWVMSFSVVCSGSNIGPAASADGAASPLAPTLRAAVQAVVSLCAQWLAPRLPAAAAQPVYSDVPSLVLAGTFDPITPPAYGQLAAQSLSRGVYVEFPDRGHAVLRGDDCSRSIVNAFFQQPNRAPASQCASDLRPFAPQPAGPAGKIGFDISRSDMLAAAAGALHLSVAEIQQYLAAGHSLAELAAVHQVPRQTLRDALLAEVHKEIDAQVHAGTVSAADGALLYQKFAQDSVDQILDDKTAPEN